jgi:hypothetical protein
LGRRADDGNNGYQGSARREDGSYVSWEASLDHAGQHHRYASSDRRDDAPRSVASREEQQCSETE